MHSPRSSVVGEVSWEQAAGFGCSGAPMKKAPRGGRFRTGQRARLWEVLKWQRSLTPHLKVVTTKSQLGINVEKLSPEHEAQAPAGRRQVASTPALSMEPVGTAYPKKGLVDGRCV